MMPGGAWGGFPGSSFVWFAAAHSAYAADAVPGRRVQPEPSVLVHPYLQFVAAALAGPPGQETSAAW